MALTPTACGLYQESDVADFQPADLPPAVRSLRQFATHSEAALLLPWGHRLRGLRVLHLDYCSSAPQYGARPPVAVERIGPPSNRTAARPTLPSGSGNCSLLEGL